MKITIIGAGYVGLVTGVGFACLGNQVKCVDVDASKIKSINAGKPPFFEEGLEKALKRASGRLKATNSLDSIKDSDVVFICVGTPSAPDGSIDLSFVKKAAEQTATKIKKKTVVAVKSTVVPGTTDSLEAAFRKRGLSRGKDYFLCMTPEFLKEGSAWSDFLKPDRIVLGVDADYSFQVLKKLHAPLRAPIFKTNPATAEMIKYVSNAFLATKITFANQVANICGRIGVDVDDAFRGVSFDKRISPHFFTAGLGFGGSCFPKDTKAIAAFALQVGKPFTLAEDAIRANELQPLELVKLAEGVMQIKGKRVGVLGLAFKANTDDVRETRARLLIQELIKCVCEVRAFDPKAMANYVKAYGSSVEMTERALDVLKQSEVVFIATPWPEFKKDILATKTPVFDAWRLLSPAEARKRGSYWALGQGREGASSEGFEHARP